MEKPQQLPPEFSDRHDVVQTVCLWRNRTCYRIEIIKRVGKPDGPAYAALLWLEQEQGTRRILVRDVGFPWTHCETGEAALEQALEALAAKVRYVSVGEAEN